MEYGPEIKVDGQPAWLGDDELAYVQWFGDHWYPNGPIEVRHANHTPLTAIRLPAEHWVYPVLTKGFTPWPGGDEAPGDWDGGEVLRRGDPSYGAYPKPWIDWYEVNQRWFHVDRDGKFADIIGYRKSAYTPTFKAGDYVVAKPGIIYSDIEQGAVYAVTLGYHDGYDSRIDFQDADGHFRHHNAGQYRPATTAEIAAYLGEVKDGSDTGVEMISLPVMTEDEVRAAYAAIYDASAGTSHDDAVTLLRTIGLIKPEPTPIEAFEQEHGLSDSESGVVEAFIAWQESRA